MKNILLVLSLLTSLTVSAQNAALQQVAAMQNTGFTEGSSVSDQEFGDLMKFPTGSIVSGSKGKLVLTTKENLKQLAGVFDSKKVLADLSIDEGSMPETHRYNNENYQNALIADSYTHIRYNLENGPILKNDFITISSNPGVGMKALETGEIVGVAMEDAASTEEDGLLKIRVNMQFQIIN